MMLDLQSVVLALLSVSIAVNAWFIKDAFGELRLLRADQNRAGTRITRHDERIRALERRRGFADDGPDDVRIRDAD